MLADAIAALEFYASAGVDFLIGDEPASYFTPKAEAKAQFQTVVPAVPAQKLQPNLGQNELLAKAELLANGAQDFAQLQQVINNFELCALKKTATQTVMGIGNICGELLIVGDVPSVADDASGKAFSDEAGELLQKMLHAIGIDLHKDCYAQHFLPWRPPVSRMLGAEEIAICLPLLKRQIELQKPKIIISLGAIPANALNQTNDSLNNLRANSKSYGVSNIFTTYHPSILLRNPSFKRQAWQDLLKIRAL